MEPSSPNIDLRVVLREEQNIENIVAEIFPHVFEPHPGNITPEIYGYLLQSQPSEDGVQKAFVESISKIDEDFRARLDKITALEKTLADAQAAALASFDAVDNDTGRPFSPFLILDPNEPPVTNYSLFNKLSMGDFLDWKELAANDLVAPKRGTFKVQVPPLLGPEDIIRAPIRSRKTRQSVPRKTAKPSHDENGKKKNRVHTGHGPSFLFNPRVLRITNYVPGGVYKAEFEVVNVLKQRNLCRLISPLSGFFEIHSQSTASYVACGISIKYVVTFRPLGYGPICDYVEAEAKDGSRAMLHIRAQNEPSELQYPPSLDIGICPPGLQTHISWTITNAGAFGMFFIMRKNDFHHEDAWRLTAQQWHQGGDAGLLRVTPKTFEVEHSRSTKLDININPSSSYSNGFEEDYVFVGHLGDVLNFQIRGGIEPLVAGLVKSLPSMKKVDASQFCTVDVSAMYTFNFNKGYPGTAKALELRLVNRTDVALLCHWRSVVPFLSPNPHIRTTKAVSDWTLDSDSPFDISCADNQNITDDQFPFIFPPQESRLFVISSLLKDYGPHRSVCQLVTSGVVAYSQSDFEKDITMHQPVISFAVDICSHCVPVDVSVPDSVRIKQPLVCGRSVSVSIPIKNNGPAAIKISLELVNGLEDLVSIRPDMIEIKSERKRNLNFCLHPLNPGPMQFDVTVKVADETRKVSVSFFTKGAKLKFKKHIQLTPIRIGDPTSSVVSIHNPSYHLAEWRAEARPNTAYDLYIEPSSGTIQPGMKTNITFVLVGKQLCDVLQEVIFHVTDNNKTRSLWLSSFIQEPKLEVTSDNLHLELCRGVPHDISLVVRNCTLLSTMLSWGEVVAPCWLTIDKPECRILDKLECARVTLTATSTQTGCFDGAGIDLLADCIVVQKVKFSGRTLGPSVVVFTDSELSRKTNDVPIFHELSLYKKTQLRLFIHNDSPVMTSFTVEMERFSDNPSMKEPKVSEKLRVAALYNDVDIFPRTKGLRIRLMPTCGKIASMETIPMTLIAFTTRWGCYEDFLRIQLDDGTICRVPFRMAVMESPIRFLHTIVTPGLPVLLFSRRTPCSDGERRFVTVQNVIPHDISVEWSVFRSDSAVKNRFGARVHVEPVCGLPVSVLNVGFPEVEGVPYPDSVFSVEPEKMEIPANSCARVAVTFDPSQLDSIGRINGILVGHATLQDQFRKRPGEHWANGLYAPSIRMILNAELIVPKLDITIPTGKLQFEIGAGNIFRHQEYQVDAEFILICSQPVSSIFRLEVPKPFWFRYVERRLLENDCIKTTPFSPDGMGWFRLQPQQTATVHLSCSMTAGSLSTIISKRGSSTTNIHIESQVEIYYGPSLASQFIPVSLVIKFPRLRLSKTHLNFYNCIIRSQATMEFCLVNSSISPSSWRVELDNEDGIFTVVPANGDVGGSSNMIEEKCSVTVKFSPKACRSYSCTLICYGLLDLEIGRISVSGSGVIDCGKINSRVAL